MRLAVLNISDWLNTLTILSQPPFLKIRPKPICFPFIVLLNINTELQNKTYDRWTDNKVQDFLDNLLHGSLDHGAHTDDNGNLLVPWKVAPGTKSSNVAYSQQVLTVCHPAEFPPKTDTERNWHLRYNTNDKHLWHVMALSSGQVRHYAVEATCHPTSPYRLISGSAYSDIFPAFSHLSLIKNSWCIFK